MAVVVTVEAVTEAVTEASEVEACTKSSSTHAMYHTHTQIRSMQTPHSHCTNDTPGHCTPSQPPDSSLPMDRDS